MASKKRRDRKSRSRAPDFPAEERCRQLLIESPSVERLDRIVRTVISSHD